MSAFLETALTLARRGWHLHPLLPNSKKPALHGEKTCPRTGVCGGGHQGWEQRATTDLDRIRSAWSTADFNIGIACGPSQLIVIDLDIPDLYDTIPTRWAKRGCVSGPDVFAAIAHDVGATVPETFTVRTPSGGSHLYFTAPPAAKLRNTTGEAGLGWKIDTRACGGYVVGPGSVLDGQPYHIVSDVDVASLPEWIAQRLTPRLPRWTGLPTRVTSTRKGKYLDAALKAESARVHTAMKGQRNSTLYVAAVALGQLVAGGELTAETAMAVLISAAGRHISVGAYSESQAHKTIESGLRDGAKRPRTIAA